MPGYPHIPHAPSQEGAIRLESADKGDARVHVQSIHSQRTASLKKSIERTSVTRRAHRGAIDNRNEQCEIDGGGQHSIIPCLPRRILPPKAAGVVPRASQTKQRWKKAYLQNRRSGSARGYSEQPAMVFHVRWHVVSRHPGPTSQTQAVRLRVLVNRHGSEWKREGFDEFHKSAAYSRNGARGLKRSVVGVGDEGLNWRAQNSGEAICQGGIKSTSRTHQLADLHRPYPAQARGVRVKNEAFTQRGDGQPVVEKTSTVNAGSNACRFEIEAIKLSTFEACAGTLQRLELEAHEREWR
ncbi:hypothetical protein DFH06DRAFT_1128739 [Mycena polygramma]|nr:hypothetical protein DFH06DRAFT_1128739 [Mycena polygramma]